MEIQEILQNIPSLGATGLDDQIKMINAINSFHTSPIMTAIEFSLKELKGIKRKRLEILRENNQ